MPIIRFVLLFCSISFLYGCKDFSDFRIIPRLNAQDNNPVALTKEEIKLKKDSVFFEKKEDLVKDKPIIPESKIPSLPEIYGSLVGHTEATGKNDGKIVEMVLRACGLGPGYSYCSCTIVWTLDSARIKHTINAWAGTAVNKKNMVYQKGNFLKEPRQGDVVSFYSNEQKRVYHVGFWDGRLNDKIEITVEGNTSTNGAFSNDPIIANGSGFFRKYRSRKGIYNISRWEEKVKR